VRGWALALLGLGALGCSGPDSRVEAGAGAGAGASTPAARFEPLPAKPATLVSSDGRVRVPVPEGEGWECLEERIGEGEAGATALRCRRSDPREFLFMAAKVSRQPADQRTDARTLLMSLYRADNERFFASVEYLRDGPAALGGASGWEAELATTHAQAGVVHKWERVAIVGDRIYAVSAEGRTQDWDPHAEVIAAWFAGVEIAG
jgi:hypothetical protein